MCGSPTTNFVMSRKNAQNGLYRIFNKNIIIIRHHVALLSELTGIRYTVIMSSNAENVMLDEI